MCPQSCSLFTSVFWLRRWRPSRPSFQNSFNILSRARHVLKSLLICLRIRQRAYASRPLKAKKVHFWQCCYTLAAFHAEFPKKNAIFPKVLNISGKGFRILLSQNILLNHFIQEKVYFLELCGNQELAHFYDLVNSPSSYMVENDGEVIQGSATKPILSKKYPIKSVQNGL